MLNYETGYWITMTLLCVQSLEKNITHFWHDLFYLTPILKHQKKTFKRFNWILCRLNEPPLRNERDRLEPMEFIKCHTRFREIATQSHLANLCHDDSKLQILLNEFFEFFVTIDAKFAYLLQNRNTKTIDYGNSVESLSSRLANLEKPSRFYVPLPSFVSSSLTLLYCFLLLVHYLYEPEIAKLVRGTDISFIIYVQLPSSANHRVRCTMYSLSCTNTYFISRLL